MQCKTRHFFSKEYFTDSWNQRQNKWKEPYLQQNISNHKLNRSDKKANTNTSPEIKISCNVKQGTSLVKNTSQTVEIKDKTNEKKPYLEQNISNHKLDGSDKKFIPILHQKLKYLAMWNKALL